VASNGLSFHSSVVYQATLEDCQLRAKFIVVTRLEETEFICVALIYSCRKKRQIIPMCYGTPFMDNIFIITVNRSISIFTFSIFHSGEKFFFPFFTNFFSFISKLATVARGQQKNKRTQSLIGNMVFGRFPKKIRNKTFYFHCKNFFHFFST
jgi:hypothetical protein